MAASFWDVGLVVHSLKAVVSLC